MAIEFNCPRCDKLLKTADDKAGLTANCPGCGAVVTVPDSPSPTELIDVDAPQIVDNPPRNAGAAADSSNLADRTGAGGRSGTRACPMCGETIAAAARRCKYCGDDLTIATPESYGLAAHRGGLILAFGILGWVVCFPFGIAAWIMGSYDLREMEAGRMDRRGEGLTRAGKILGIVQVCLMAVAVVIYGVIAILMLAANVRV